MNLKHLRTFVTVAEHGTVSRAAHALRVTQPALSRQINDLEYSFGFSLFERVGRRLQLTACGEQIIGECRSLLMQARALNERAQSFRQGEMRVLKVAASALTIEGIFPTFLQRYTRCVPGVRLKMLEEDDPAEHLNMLERGEVHLSVNVINIVKVDGDRFATYLLPQFQVLAACARSLRIERGDTIDIRRLTEHPLLVPNSRCGTRNIFDAACRRASAPVSTSLESSAARALLAFAAAGQGVAIVPSILHTDRRTLRIMRVTHESEPLQIALAVLWNKRRELPPYADGFAELLGGHILEVFPHARPN